MSELIKLEQMAKVVRGVLLSYNSRELTGIKYGDQIAEAKFGVYVMRCYFSGKNDNKYATAVLYKEDPVNGSSSEEVFRFFPTGIQSEIEFAMPFYSRIIRGNEKGIVLRMLQVAGIEDAINDDL